MKNKTKNWFANGNAFITLPVILITMLVFIPMVSALFTSFQSGPPTAMTFNGLGNYQRMLSDSTFKKAFGNTFLYLLVQVPIMLFLALIVSNILNDKKLKFKGLIDAPIQWLTDPFWAKVLIIFAITWRWTGYNMIFFISGMQNIDPSIYEAAEIDGATKWDQFFKITIPNLRPIILFTTITSTIGTLQLFDEVQNITGGGPANATTTLSQYIYNLSYKFTPNFGYAAAVSFVIVIAIVILSIIQTKIGGKEN